METVEEGRESKERGNQSGRGGGADERETEKRGEKGNRLKEKIYGSEKRKEAREEMRMQRKWGKCGIWVRRGR